MFAVVQELKLLLHRSTLLYSQGKMYGYIDTLLTMLAMLLKVRNGTAVTWVKTQTTNELRRKASGLLYVSGFIILLDSNLAGSLQYWHSCL